MTRHGRQAACEEGNNLRGGGSVLMQGSSVVFSQHSAGKTGGREREVLLLFVCVESYERHPRRTEKYL